MNIRTDILLRVYGAYAVLIVFASLIVLRIWDIQIVEGSKWKTLASNLTTHYADVEAIRGSIYSEDGRLMAASLPEYEIRMDMASGALTKAIFRDKVDSLSMKLSALFRDRTSKEYAQALKKAYTEKERYFLVKRKVSFTDLNTLKTFPIFNLGRYKGGLIIVEYNKRILPFKSLAARTIGYKTETVQPVGIEGAYDSYMSGTQGKHLMQRVAGSVWIPLNNEDEISPVNGADIISTLNINIQDIAQNALMKELVAKNANSGTVILMETATGEVRAVVNLTQTEDGSYAERYNMAIGFAGEPGSTFKLASLLVALNDGKVKLNDTIDIGPGYVDYYNRRMRDSKKPEKSRISLQQAFERSSNVGISKAIYEAYKNEPKKFIESLKKIGFGQKAGLQIPGEAHPHLKHPDDKDWYGTTLPWMSIGYEQTLTPLQMLTFYNAIANNGKMMAPLFVKEIRRSGESVEVFKPRVLIKKIASDQALADVKKALEGVIERGTGANIASNLYKIAGKTGTAQIAYGSQGYKKDGVRYLSSFCGYFPANDPKYSMIVVINSPSGSSFYGSIIAAPIFKEIADKVYAGSINTPLDLEQKYKGRNSIPLAKAGFKTENEIIYKKLGITVQDQSNSNWVSTVSQGSSITLSSLSIVPNKIPNVMGMGLRDAIYLLENIGLQTTVNGSGAIVGQSLAAGSQIIKNSRITLYLN